MTKKWRNAESYYGNTAGARKRQRANLIPGNTWQKRRTKELRLNCWWEDGSLGDKQFIFEGYENKRNLKDFDAMPKEELKDEEYLNSWWDSLSPEDKKFIYRAMMDPLTPKEKTPILDHIQKCLEEKLTLLKKG